MTSFEWGAIGSLFSSSESKDPGQLLFETPSPENYGSTLDNGATLPSDFWKNSRELINTLAGGYATVKRAEEQSASAARARDKTPVPTNTPIAASGSISISPIAILAVVGLGLVAWKLTR